MEQFNLALKLDGQKTILQASRLDPQYDADGYVCYAVYAAKRNSLICVNEEYYNLPLIYTPQDAWNYYEKINYPESAPAYSEDDAFNTDEIRLIGKTIGEHIACKQIKSLVRS
jgi:hypothetical protein